MPPAISVLIAVRNSGRFLEPALRSLASQSFSDYEAIIVDNVSRDGTGHLLSEWAAKVPRIRLFDFQTPSLARCLNFAASPARAPLLARLDGDDIILPDGYRCSRDKTWTNGVDESENHQLQQDVPFLFCNPIVEGQRTRINSEGCSPAATDQEYEGWSMWNDTHESAFLKSRDHS